MGSSHDINETEDDSSETAGRGFFGRLIGAFSSNSPESGEDGTGQPAAGSPKSATVLGLSNLRSLRVDDVAIPKIEIAAVPLDIGKDDLVAVFRDHGFSRLPV